MYYLRKSILRITADFFFHRAVKYPIIRETDTDIVGNRLYTHLENS